MWHKLILEIGGLCLGVRFVFGERGAWRAESWRLMLMIQLVCCGLYA